MDTGRAGVRIRNSEQGSNQLTQNSPKRCVDESWRKLRVWYGITYAYPDADMYRAWPEIPWFRSTILNRKIKVCHDLTFTDVGWTASQRSTNLGAAPKA